MKRTTKMMMMAGGGRGGDENARGWRITEEPGAERRRMGGYGGEAQRMGYEQGGGYHVAERRRTGGYGDDTRRMGYEPYGGYEGEESRRRRDRRGRFTRSGGYDDDEEDEDPRIAAQHEDEWPMRSGYGPHREQMPPSNVIGFSTAPPHQAPHQPRGGEAMSAEFPRHMADEWTATMKNEDGTTGPHWTFEQAKQLMAGKGYKLDPVEFWAALNMMYSDYCKVAKRHNINSVDFYAGLAEAFLNDKDAGEGKLRKYYEYIVK